VLLVLLQRGGGSGVEAPLPRVRRRRMRVRRLIEDEDRKALNGHLFSVVLHVRKSHMGFRV
jgi:hypothetical protein